MSFNPLARYQERVASGEIERAKAMDPIEKSEKNPKSLRAAINAKCYDCCCYSRTEVGKCTSYECPLHKLRPWVKKQ